MNIYVLKLNMVTFHQKNEELRSSKTPQTLILEYPFSLSSIPQNYYFLKNLAPMQYLGRDVYSNYCESCVASSSWEAREMVLIPSSFVFASAKSACSLSASALTCARYASISSK